MTVLDGKNQPNYPELSKEERIKKELERISAFFEKSDANKRAIIEPLIQNAAFMRVTLEDLQEIINSEGVTETYQNGANQKGVKQSAALQSYNSVAKTYAGVIKTLTAFVPVERKAVFHPPYNIAPEKTPEELEEEKRLADERDDRINREIQEAAKRQRLERERQNINHKSGRG